MSLADVLAKLPTAEEAAKLRPIQQKHELKTKLDRVIEKKTADREDKQKLDAWALAVKVFDNWRDRKTGKKVKRTRQLDPLRAEAHHVVPKSDRNVRYDVRNGICLSFATHDAVERNTLRIVGTKFFTVNGKTYINAREPVTFEVVK